MFTLDMQNPVGDLMFNVLSVWAGMVMQAAVRDALNASLSTLDARERVVVRMRYGLDDGCPRTLEDIGKYFKVCAKFCSSWF